VIEPVHVKMARAALGWGVRDLGAKAGMAANTVSRFELGSEVMLDTVRKLQKALEKEGVIFILRDASGGPGVRLKR
jgi:transcriptional regulator with XRE-family HTH domain